MILITLIASAYSFSAKAEDKIVCGYKTARTYEREVRYSGGTDKFMHCTLSCIIALKCGGGQSLTIGLLKEIKDLFDDGNAEFYDIIANLKGIRFGNRMLFNGRGFYENMNTCFSKCESIYPKNN